MTSFRNLLRDPDRKAIGTFVKVPAIEIAEIIALAGFDFVIIDTEHALLSVRDVYQQVVTYSALGVAPLVRVTDHGYGDAQRYLDAGAAGILIPHVSDGAQAEIVGRQLLFPPAGTRGMGMAARAGHWGALEGGSAEYIRYGQEDAVRVAMVEEAGAVADIEAILAAPGIDAIFVGPGDLSMSMGEPMGSEAVRNAVSTAIGAAVAAGVPVGTVVAGAEAITLRARQGCSYIVVGNDTGWLSGVARRTLAETRDAITAAKEPV